MMKIIFILVALIMSSAHAQDLPLKTYVKMQEALANDDLKTALVTHKEICSKELAKYTKEYGDCQKTFKDIDEIRSSFKTLSKVYMSHADQQGMSGLMKASCPMANAQWIQKAGPIKNPYYGKSMLECGEKI